jgi:Mg/Co/Ni transporter MgtE
MGRLVGRITIDDIIDVIRDEADQDYQLAAGISKDVEADSIQSTFALVGTSIIGRFYLCKSARII